MSDSQRPKTRTAILISGRGSNMQSIVEAARHPAYPTEIAAVMANVPDAAGLAWANDNGIATRAIDHRAFRGNRAGFDAALQTALDTLDIQFVVLAGFMRILTADFTEAWRGRMINIHPSLLPLFRGLDTHARAIEAGCRIAGCTVHYVVPELDAGPIIAQAAVPVHNDDTPETLAARVLIEEHQLYSLAVAAVTAGHCQLEGDRVVWSHLADDDRDKNITFGALRVPSFKAQPNASKT